MIQRSKPCGKIHMVILCSYLCIPTLIFLTSFLLVFLLPVLFPVQANYVSLLTVSNSHPPTTYTDSGDSAHSPALPLFVLFSVLEIVPSHMWVLSSFCCGLRGRRTAQRSPRVDGHLGWCWSLAMLTWLCYLVPVPVCCTEGLLCHWKRLCNLGVSTVVLPFCPFFGSSNCVRISRLVPVVSG